MRFLAWAILIFAVLWVLRGKKTVSSGTPSASPPPSPSPSPSPSDGRAMETMLRCTHCGMHFPASEAVFDASHAAFCSSDHKRLHASR